MQHNPLINIQVNQIYNFNGRAYIKPEYIVGAIIKGKNGELDKKTAKFIEILVELSKSLEKETVFEGVETKAQRDFLKSINCDQAQGYFYSKPLSEQEFLKFVKSHK